MIYGVDLVSDSLIMIDPPLLKVQSLVLLASTQTTHRYGL